MPSNESDLRWMGFDVHIISYDEEGVWFRVIASIIMVVPLRMKENFGASLVEVEKIDVPYFYRANHKFI